MASSVSETENMHIWRYFKAWLGWHNEIAMCPDISNAEIWFQWNRKRLWRNHVYWFNHILFISLLFYHQNQFNKVKCEILFKPEFAVRQRKWITSIQLYGFHRNTLMKISWVFITFLLRWIRYVSSFYFFDYAFILLFLYLFWLFDIFASKRSCFHYLKSLKNS